MSNTHLYLRKYEHSLALIIGINEYQHIKGLEYACNDASVLAETLIRNFGFTPENVTLLRDSEATQASIRSHVMKFSDTMPDDRVIIFFAGHGHTAKGRRKDVGFLIPFDGNPTDLSTFIKWDALTQDAELFPAKHVLFVMDACYGGLALSRYVHPGSMRYAHDMLQRYSRQVLTAGKADEVVADSGGPRHGHSVFTGHFLNALDGAAAPTDGIITANAVMAYVYDRVAKDPHSRQTPHYGFIDGDGDFIFSGLPADTGQLQPENQTQNILISVPPSFSQQPDLSLPKSPVETVKEFLSDSKYRIKLDELFASETRSVLSQLGEDMFPTNPPQISREAIKSEFADRIKRYEEILKPLQGMVALLGKWAGPEHRHIAERIFARLAEVNGNPSGMTAWLGLRWYPITLLMYSGGIAALAAERYDMLAAVLTAKVGAGYLGRDIKEVVIPSAKGMLEVTQNELFKTLPGHERQYTPGSEYMLTAFQPVLEDALYLGHSYEHYFDKFEVFRALVYIEANERDEDDPRLKSDWGPIGRFGWKFRTGRSENSPFSQVILEASRQRDGWPPLRVGLFEGSYARFEEIVSRLRGFLGTLPWF